MSGVELFSHLQALRDLDLHLELEREESRALPVESSIALLQQSQRRDPLPHQFVHSHLVVSGRDPRSSRIRAGNSRPEALCPYGSSGESDLSEAGLAESESRPVPGRFDPIDRRMVHLQLVAQYRERREMPLTP